MKIAITGVTGFRNRGVEALVQPIVSSLLGKYPRSSIQIATWSPEYDRTRIQNANVEFVEDRYLLTGKWSNRPGPQQSRSLISRVKRRLLPQASLFSRKVGCQNKDCSMPFDRPDIVIVSGGDLFSSDYGTASLKHFGAPIFWAKANNIPAVLLGQSVGRFKSDEDSETWQNIVEAASAVSLREVHSLSYLNEHFESDDSKKITVTADTAFLLEPCGSIELYNDWFGTRPVVAVSISESICKWTGGDYASHISAWQSILKHMLDQWKVHVAVIPHVQERFSDDRVLSTRIHRALKFDPRIRVFAEDLTAAEYKGIVARCEFVVAERMHAAIAGFSTGVCTVPIEYSIKAKGITAMLMDGSEFNADDVAIPLDEFLNVNKTLPRLDNLWSQRKRLQDIIRGNLPHVVEKAEANFLVIEECL